MAYPVPAEYRVNQGFRSYATAGVVGRPDGSEIQYLVWLYGDYQHYGHAGADIACPIGTPVYAIADGIVVWADWGYNLPGDDSWGPNGYFKRWGMYKNFPGICTVLWHPHLNKFSIYGHQSSNDEVKVGQQVREGQQIGKSGNTKTRGETVGPHLHIAIVGDFTNYSTGGAYIFGCEDPVPYFTTGSLSYASESITPLEVDDMTPDQLLNFEFELKGGAMTTMLTQFQNMDENNRAMLAQQQASQRYAEAVNGKIDQLAQALPASTLDEQITMPDGRVTTPRQEIAWLAANFEAMQTNIQAGK
jgi:Peptidase family M23